MSPTFPIAVQPVTVPIVLNGPVSKSPLVNGSVVGVGVGVGVGTGVGEAVGVGVPVAVGVGDGAELITVKWIVIDVPAEPVPADPLNGVATSVYDPSVGVHGL